MRRSRPRRSSRSDSISSRSRSSSIRSRACGQAVPTPALQGNVWYPAAPTAPGQQAPPRPSRAEMDRAQIRRSRRRPPADGRGPRGMVVRRSRGGVQGRGARARRDIRRAIDRHQPMETRSAMAYWRNGKLYLHASTQSLIRTVDSVRRLGGRSAAQVVLISEYCGGGFGSKGGGAVSMAIPALLSKKANAPVMMRISREEESFIGRAPHQHDRTREDRLRERRPHHRARPLHRPGQRPYGPMGDHRSAGNAASLVYQPAAMRWRAVNVLTNTPPRYATAFAGPDAGATASSKAWSRRPRSNSASIRSRFDGSIHRKAKRSTARRGRRERRHVTSAFVKQALDRGVAAVRLEQA